MPSVNLVQVLNSAQKNGLQGFLSSVQQFSEMLRRGLLNRYTGENLYRGFESLPLRQTFIFLVVKSHVCHNECQYC